jgi:hypothetical protein
LFDIFIQPFFSLNNHFTKNKMRIKIIAILFFQLFCASILMAQEKQNRAIVKGNIIDKALRSALTGASIRLLNADAVQAISDTNGYFILSHVPLGRQNIEISFLGYKSVTLSNISVESGKETFLLIEMEEEIVTHKEVVVQNKTDKTKALNTAALVSARMFSVEETRRYAAGLNDPSRIATAYAGVASNGDKNSLVIRGNAPNGLLWRMEGVDIPNPNHFARVSTSGGGISILSAQLLANSDFMTGAFPAEYGNALSGVFDINLRKGNKDKREFTFSASTIGLDMSAEGYFKKGNRSAYLVNYRYGFLSLMDQLGFKISDASTTYQDLSFNIHLPTKDIGNFSFFGFGGLSQQKIIAANDSVTFIKDPSKRTGSIDISNTGAVGIVHTILLDKKTLLKTVFSVNGNDYKEQDNHFDKINGPLIITRNNQFKENNAILSVVATHKINRNHLFKIGVNTSGKYFSLYQREAVSNVLRDKVKEDGNTRLTQYFAQWKWDPSDKIRLQMGMHGQFFSLNRSSVLEPRAGIRIQTGNNQFLSFGYGLHSQIQPLGNYFARIKVGTDSLQPNKTLDFSKSNHFVLGYSIRLARDWNVKAELYHQSLFNIPISASKSSSFSVINVEDDYAIETLANNGKGTNDGIEFTLERYWNDQFYLLGTLSFYDSKYLPSDHIWRNTRFNSNNAWTFLMGKEWNLHSKRISTLAFDIKMIHNGGVRVTPINLAQSIIQKTTVLDTNRIYEEKLLPFFRIDMQMEWKVQYKKMTGSFIAGVQNLTNRQNVVSQTYDANIKGIRYSYLLGLIPVVAYKIDF